ncbi:PHP domain-containing protein [Pontibacter mucosus]|uniref:PHP domain-containing protein n=1 Tax=Pontibacter mucosus TaxID=1649266 RepID=A0A2T5Y9J9_9BACT|nr:AAA family ATPase [Pontibacter mucosus]PTX13080.1 PHP domain-containing protein [Pontibacter mucosus]
MNPFSIAGSKWWKCDFHNHTPASTDYGKGPNQAVLLKRSPREWLLDYMKAEIDCVGVTDHNSGEWIDILKIELELMEAEQPEGYRAIVVFPGVEVSVNGGIHIVALFDPSKGTKDINGLLGAVGFPLEHVGKSEYTSKESIDEVIDSIIDAGGIAIPAHVDKPTGLFEVYGGNVTVRNLLLRECLLAIELINKESVLPDTYKQHRKRLNLAEIVGSDSHLPEQAGTAYTWVKMEEPSIEALKLAFHDGVDGIIRHESPHSQPNQIAERYYIRKLVVKDGYKAGNGQPLVVEFSPWQTTLIGGRGSGKSSIINYLRIALDKCDGIPDKIKADFENFKKVGSRGGVGMLKASTEIEVLIQKDTRLLKVTWNQTDNCILSEMNEQGDWDLIGPMSALGKMFPMRIFNQKQLYELTESPNHLLNLIDSQFDKNAWSQELERLEAIWYASRRNQRELANRMAGEPETKELYKSVEGKIKIFEAYGNELLTKFKEEQQSNRLIKSGINSVKGLTDNLQKIIESQSITSIYDSKMGDELKTSVSSFDEEVKAQIVSISKSIENLRQIVIAFDTNYESSEWYTKSQGTKIEYDKFINSLKESNPDVNLDYGALLAQKQGLEEKLNQYKGLKDEYDAITQNIKDQYQLIIQHHQQLRTLRNEVIHKWSKNTQGGTLAVYLNELGDFVNSEISFRDLIRRPGSEFASELLTLDDDGNPTGGFISKILQEQDMQSRWGLLQEIKQNIITASEADPKNLGIKFIRHFQKLKETTPEDIDRLWLWVPEDRIVLKLKRQGGKEEDIESGSAGQKTAGILSLLLAIDNVPLIIDQPEDDLDTRMVTELIVENFKRLKPHRQVIVVTHNPNIAVNASSEKIVELEFSSGQIRKKCSGALQKHEVRLAVCDVMEGGRDALESRYYRISKALT